MCDVSQIYEGSWGSDGLVSVCWPSVLPAVEGPCAVECKQRGCRREADGRAWAQGPWYGCFCGASRAVYRVLAAV